MPAGQNGDAKNPYNSSILLRKFVVEILKYFETSSKQMIPTLNRHLNSLNQTECLLNESSDGTACYHSF